MQIFPKSWQYMESQNPSNLYPKCILGMSMFSGHWMLIEYPRSCLIKLESSQVVCFTITLGSVNVMVLSRDYDGHCLLKALLSDYELNMAETEALIRGFSVDMSPEHLRDNITASRGTELWVEVVAERKLLNDQQYMDPCWQLMIHIGAGSAMP